ncbi:hypothetical protein [Nocardia cyriacigeorgica]|nr:hypothetical protein [Nocardia cyriacigeorgica]
MWSGVPASTPSPPGAPPPPPPPPPPPHRRFRVAKVSSGGW